MADLEKTVAIIFEGVDQMGAGVTSATRQIGSVTESVDRAAQPLANFTLGVLKAEAALIATGAAVTGLAIKAAGEFDTSFREITTLLDESEGSLIGLRGELLEYASTSTQALGTVTGAFYNLISAGNDTEEAMKLLAAAEQLAVGGKTDLDTAARALAGTLSAYGADADDATEYTDTLFVAMRNGMTTIGELASALPSITPLAAQLGIDFDTLAAAVSALTTTGLSTSQAVTQVGAAMNSILGPSQQALTLAEELGIEFNATALRSQGLEAFLGNLTEATGGSEQAMRTLFGSTEATKGALSLVGAVAEAFTGTLGDMDEKAGETAAAFEKMVDDVSNGTQRIKNAIVGTLIGIGLPLLEEFTGIQAAIAEIFNAIGISLNDGQLSQFVNLLEEMLQGIEQTLRDVARNLPEALESADWSGFLEGIQVVRNAVAGLFDGADITTAEGLASVIGTLGTAFNLFAQYTAGTIAAIGPFIEHLANLAQWIMKIDPEWVALMGKIGGGAVVLTTVLSALSSLLSIVNSLAGASGAIPAMTAATGRLAAALGTTGAGLIGSAGAAAFAIQQLYQEVRQFNDFRFNFSEGLEQELAQTTGAQRVATEYSLFQVEKIARAYNGLSDFFGWGDEAAADFDRVSEEAANAAIEVAQFADAAGEVDQSINSSTSAILRGFRSWEQWTEAAESARLRTEAATQALDTNATTLWDHIDSLDGVSAAWERVGENTYQAARGLGEIDEALALVQSQFDAGMIDEDTFNEMVSVLEGMRNESDRAATSQKELAGEVLNSEQTILAARQAVLDYKLELEGLASNERIRKVELAVELGIAQLEADTRKFESIMESINTTITSTGELLGGEFGLLNLRFGEEVSRWDQLDLDKHIAAERKARDEAFKLQQKQIEAEIKFMEAKTKALQNGDGLIKIDSDGLEPALEMIMWQILEKVQLRANAEGAEFLLGIGGTGGSDPDPDPGDA